VEYIVNMTDDSVIVTVFNNDGVVAVVNDEDLAYADATVTVNVEYTGIGTVSQVNDWITGEVLDTLGIAGEMIRMELPFAVQEGDLIRGEVRNHRK
jgi:hypothetical protein